MKQKAYYDPLLFKSPIGAISKGETVRFSLKVNEENELKNIFFVIKNDLAQNYEYIPMKKNNDFFVCDYKFSQEGHYFYNFKLCYEYEEIFVNKTYDNFSYLNVELKDSFFQLVTENKYESKNSIQGGVIYQIMVDRFCKVGEVAVRPPLVFREDWAGSIKKNTTDPIKINQEVFCGNFDGIISKIDYLKWLNISVIYLNPICLSNSNHKYDTANYLKIDDMFGGEEKFAELVKKCKENGIKIIIDGVYNHTGSDSIYFNKENTFKEVGAYNSKDSKYYDWFTFINYPDEYLCWWGINTMPSIRGNSEGFHNLITGKNGVIEKFINLGVFGIRLDVVDELTDEFTKKISDKILSYGSDHIVMGEVWEDASTKISYSSRRKYFSNNELNSVMNYPIKVAILNYLNTKNAYELNATIRMIKNGYPKAVADNLMNFLGTHDTGRVLSEIDKITNGDRQKSFQLLKVATGIMFTVVGVPSIFYGDERGMSNNDESSRGCIDWRHLNVEIFEWYKMLCHIRKNPVFVDGEINVLYCKTGKIIFERKNESGRVIVLANLQSSPLEINLKGNFYSLIKDEKINDFVLTENMIEILIENE